MQKSHFTATFGKPAIDSHFAAPSGIAVNKVEELAKPTPQDDPTTK